jgi:hypothetical protein
MKPFRLGMKQIASGKARIGALSVIDSCTISIQFPAMSPSDRVTLADAVPKLGAYSYEGLPSRQFLRSQPAIAASLPQGFSIVHSQQRTPRAMSRPST